MISCVLDLDETFRPGTDGIYWVFVMRQQHTTFLLRHVLPKLMSWWKIVFQGIGSYTSAAVASIACGEKVAVIDANVIRILARLKCLTWDTKNGKAYTGLANQLVDPQRPGDFNQVSDLSIVQTSNFRPPEQGGLHTVLCTACTVGLRYFRVDLTSWSATCSSLRKHSYS